MTVPKNQRLTPELLEELARRQLVIRVATFDPERIGKVPDEELTTVISLVTAIRPRSERSGMSHLWLKFNQAPTTPHRFVGLSIESLGNSTAYRQEHKVLDDVLAGWGRTSSRWLSAEPVVALRLVDGLTYHPIPPADLDLMLCWATFRGALGSTINQGYRKEFFDMVMVRFQAFIREQRLTWRRIGI